jgi:hypothetical protein
MVDGANPTLLTGYGGFDISLTRTFERDIYLWLEHGGIYAVANLRGGAEFGEDWHRAGMLDKKQNVFDDFIAAAPAPAKTTTAQSWNRPYRSAGISKGRLSLHSSQWQSLELGLWVAEDLRIGSILEWCSAAFPFASSGCHRIIRFAIDPAAPGFVALPSLAGTWFLSFLLT